eukprot:TRINITY_DN16479_c0_g3_i1.p1 TRINITY_DN16479_c0_g3~~TRINITY_DN16479_c0_g3_i1.p1  ORF type:complete len:271 (+),score=32.37 TRINITY_DN16479_c0_g3_i1:65-814(+)
MENEGVQAIPELLEVNKSIATLDCTRIILVYSNDRKLERIIESLERNNTLKQLRLKNAEITNSFAVSIASSLMVNRSLMKLDLGKSISGIKFVEAKIISNGLMANKGLVILKLNYSYLDDKSVKAICEALVVNYRLSELSLVRNKFCVKGAEAIGEMLKVNRGLTYLKLCRNKIMDEGAKFISEGLRSNDKLERLNLVRCDITDKGAAALSEALKDNKTLKMLELLYDRISWKFEKAIAEELSTRNLDD